MAGRTRRRADVGSTEKRWRQSKEIGQQGPWYYIVRSRRVRELGGGVGGVFWKFISPREVPVNK